LHNTAEEYSDLFAEQTIRTAPGASGKAKLNRGILYQIRVTFKMSLRELTDKCISSRQYVVNIYTGDLCIYIKNNRRESQNWSTTEIQIYGKESKLMNSGNAREYKQN